MSILGRARICRSCCLLENMAGTAFEASRIAGRNEGPGSPDVDTVRESQEKKKRPVAARVFWDPRQSQEMTLRVRVNTSSAAIAGPEGGEV